MEAESGDSVQVVRHTSPWKEAPRQWKLAHTDGSEDQVGGEIERQSLSSIMSASARP